MTRKPDRIIIDNNTDPVFQRGGSVPLHLEEDVKATLNRDVSLGIIKKLPVNTLTEWCARQMTGQSAGMGVSVEKSP